MPNKYPQKKGWSLPKQNYKLHNWPQYNQALRQRGSIEFWVSDEAIEKWYEINRVYDGTGTPKKFTDFSIIVCHEIRQVYKLSLRQCEGFINSIFDLMKVPIVCPDYSCLSKRLSLLNINSPRYKKESHHKNSNSISAMTIDSSGLQRFGRDEWHQEKYSISAQRSWRKLHVAVDDEHIIHACILTDRFVSDDQAIDPLLDQIDMDAAHVLADGSYDKNPVYNKLSTHFSTAEIIIPPDSDAVYSHLNHVQRNRNLQEIKTFGRMNWQRVRGYGKRNYAELCIQRYKRILGNKLHARQFSRQKNEAMIGCSILNKMTQGGMPQSYKFA